MITATETEVIVYVPADQASTKAEAKRVAGRAVGRKRALGANPFGQVRIFTKGDGYEVRFERY